MSLKAIVINFTVAFFIIKIKFYKINFANRFLAYTKKTNCSIIVDVTFIKDKYVDILRKSG